MGINVSEITCLFVPYNTIMNVDIKPVINLLIHRLRTWTAFAISIDSYLVILCFSVYHHF